MGELLGILTGSGKITAEEQPLTLIESATDDGLKLYFYLNKINISIIKPSDNGGILEIRDTNGNVKWQITTDHIRKSDVDFGKVGLLFDDDYRLGVDAITHGSGNPAEAYISVEGRYDFRT